MFQISHPDQHKAIPAQDVEDGILSAAGDFTNPKSAREKG